MARFEDEAVIKIRTENAEAVAKLNKDVEDLKKSLKDAERAALALKIEKGSKSEEFKKADLAVRGLSDKLKLAKKDLDAISNSGNKVASSFEKVATSIAGITIGAKALSATVSVFKDAVAESNKLEKSLLKVSAAAKLTGNDADKAKSDVVALAEDGQAGADQLADAYGKLLKQGINQNFIPTFLKAGKVVATFSGVTGDAGADLNAFIDGLSRGSIETIENLDPSLVQLIKSMGGITKVTADAALKQQVLNKVVEIGAKQQDDYNKFIQSGIGQQKALEASYNSLLASIGDAVKDAAGPAVQFFRDTIDGIRKAFDGLSPSGKKAVLAIGTIGVAIAALIPIVAGLATAVAAATGGLSLLIPVAVGLVTALGVGLASLKDQVDQVDAQAALVKQYDELVKLQEKGLLLESERNRLLEIQKGLVKDLGPAYAKAYEEAARSSLPLLEQYNLLRAFKREAAADAKLNDAELASEIKRLEAAQKIASGVGRGTYSAAAGFAIGGSNVTALNTGVDADRLANLKQLQADRQRIGGSGGGGGLGGGAARTSDFLLSELRKSLNGVTSELQNFIAANAGNAAAIAQAEVKATELRIRIIADANAAIEQGLAEGLDAEILAIRQQQKIDERYLDDNAKELENHVEQKKRIQEKADRDELNAKLKNAEQTAQALSQVNSAVISAIQSNGSASSALGSVSGLASAGGSLATAAGDKTLGAALPIAGIAVGIAGAIFAAVESEAEEKKRKEEKRLADIEKKKDDYHRVELARLKTLQQLEKIRYDLQVRIADLARAQDEFALGIDKLNATSQSEILGLDINAGNREVNQTLRAAGFGPTRGATTQSKSDFLSEQAIFQATATAKNREIQAAITNFQFGPGDMDRLRGLRSQLIVNSQYFSESEKTKYRELFGVIEDAILSYVSSNDPKVIAAYQARLNRAAGTVGATDFSLLNQARDEQSARITSAIDTLGGVEALKSQLGTQLFADAQADIDRASAAGESEATTTARRQELAAEIAGFLGLDVANFDPNAGEALDIEDKNKFDLMVDLLKQVEESTGKTAKNTDPKLLEDRNRDFLDISRRRAVFGGGSAFGSLGLQSVALGNPDAIQSVALQTRASAAQGMSAQLLTLAAEQVALARTANALLATIAANTDGDASTSGINSSDVKDIIDQYLKLQA